MRNAHRHLCRGLILFLALNCLAASEKKSDWPKFRGENQDAISQETEVFSPNQDFRLRIAWKKKLGSGYSSISVADGFAVTMFSDNTYDYVIALDSASGEEKWRYRIDSTYIGHHGSHNGPISTPAIDDNQVFCLGTKGQLFALDLKTGKLNWTVDMQNDLNAFEPFYGFATSPNVSGNVLVIQTGGVQDNMISGLDKHDGSLLWSSGSDTVMYQSAITTRIGGVNQILAAGDRLLYGIDPVTGATLWQFRHDGQWESMTPIRVHNDKVYLNHSNREPILLQIIKENETYTARELWRTRDLGRSYSPSVYYNNYLYGYLRRLLTCVDAATGKSVWKSRPPGDGFPIVVDGYLVVTTKKGSLHIIEATPQRYNEIASLKVLDGLTWTPASFANGKIYVRNLYEMACVEVSKSSALVADMPESKKEKKSSKFTSFINSLETAKDKSAMIEEFMATQKQFPIIEGDTLVHVVYRGEIDDVAIAGDMLGWRAEEDMLRIDGTDFYYYSFVLEPDAKINYRFIKDMQERMLDPLNPNKVTTIIMGDFSELAMPKWVAPAHLNDPTGAVRGKLDSLQFESEILQNVRTIQVYRPPGYEQSSARNPVLYINDGKNAIERGKMVNSFDNLIGENVVDPFIAVFIYLNSKNGFREHIRELKDKYTKMLADELVPYIDKTYRTVAEPKKRFIMGGGPGGYISIYAALYRPGVFGKVAGQSNWFIYEEWIELEELLRQSEASPTAFYFDWGTYDWRTDDNNINLLGSNAYVGKLLQEKGFSVILKQVNESWGWSSWRNRTGSILQGFFFISD